MSRARPGSGRTFFVPMGKPNRGSYEFVKRMSLITGVPQIDMRLAYNAFLAVLRVEIENGREVHFNGIGKFQYKQYKERVLFDWVRKEHFVVPANGKLVFNATGPIRKCVYEATKDKDVDIEKILKEKLEKLEKLKAEQSLLTDDLV